MTPDAGVGTATDACRPLMLLWVFIWSVLRILKTDIYGADRRGDAAPGARGRSRRASAPYAARHLVVTEGALTGARITLSEQPVLIGKRRRPTLVLTDDYASTRHARLSMRGPSGRRRSRIDQRHLPGQGEGDDCGTSSDRNAGSPAKPQSSCARDPRWRRCRAQRSGSAPPIKWGYPHRLWESGVT